MKPKIGRNLAVLLALCLVGVLVLGYLAFQKGPGNQAQNANLTWQKNQTYNGNATWPQNQTQNATIPWKNQTRDGNTTGQNQTQENATLTNPAAVYCVQHGGISKIITAADGSQSGVCVLPDGTECDEWAYYWGTCPSYNASGLADQTVNQTILPPPPLNLSSLDESDFMVADYSMPNLLTSQKVFELPPPPGNNTAPPSAQSPPSGSTPPGGSTPPQ